MGDHIKKVWEANKAEIENMEGEVNSKICCKKIFELARQLQETGAEIEDTNHKLFFLNQEIDTFEKFFMQRQKENEKTQKQQIEQRKVVFQKFQEATDRKVRITF